MRRGSGDSLAHGRFAQENLGEYLITRLAVIFVNRLGFFFKRLGIIDIIPFGFFLWIFAVTEPRFFGVH